MNMQHIDPKRSLHRSWSTPDTRKRDRRSARPRTVRGAGIVRPPDPPYRRLPHALRRG